MQANLVGWDIGGAHLKAAALNQAGEIIAIFQQPCPLWKGLEHLQQAVNAVMQALDSLPISQHAITMTGELVDLFTDRDDGVKQIINAMSTLLAGTQISVFAGQSGLVPTEHIGIQHYAAIASANWLASALFAAQHVNNGLFVDIGTTTTDILLLNDKQVLAQGYSDYQRLISKELIYTGIIRTAVMAVARTVEDEGHSVGLMAEYFATMADVYRLTGELNERHDQTDTADGAEKTPLASAKRLARMIGCDASSNTLPRWQRLAKDIRRQQLEHIQQGCQAQLQRHSGSIPITFIGAGVGRFLVKEMAIELGHAYLDFSSLLPSIMPQPDLSAADCAPAVAVAYLQRQTSQ
ncbi:hydantoinase/oxoprolinase family protein [Crenothrix sp.]|uniref:hydantoinase/oxoprolinase family protein n=1 Tax=Crenothrix sp. TaxID=3100433 RepID=UPI00374DF79E